MCSARFLEGMNGSRGWLECFVSRNLGCKSRGFSRDLSELSVGESEDFHFGILTYEVPPRRASVVSRGFSDQPRRTPAKDQFAHSTNIHHRGDRKSTRLNFSHLG